MAAMGWLADATRQLTCGDNHVDQKGPKGGKNGHRAAKEFRLSFPASNPVASPCDSESGTTPKGQTNDRKTKNSNPKKLPSCGFQQAY